MFFGEYFRGQTLSPISVEAIIPVNEKPASLTDLTNAQPE
jgi:hypothetical protein